MNSKRYITTTIPYVNAKPHVGFALELVQADALARYSRLIGRPTRLQTGTDENALKNVLAAREEGVPAEELVRRNSDAFRALGTALNVQADRFIRTTEPAHRAGVHWFWRRLRPEDVYRRAYRGLYCTGCEDFYLEKDLADGLCPVHRRPLVEVEEENWFFRLSTYQAQIEDLLASGRLRVVPEARLNEILSFVRAGLRDFSISRSAERAYGWGIPVPGDDSQVIYVWLDALVNYLSGLGLGNGGQQPGFWEKATDKIHVLGKDVWKFHAVYWPAFLLSAGLPLPDTILVHGFLTVNGQKISKTLGNVVDPFAYIARYGADAVRYYLLRAVLPFDDGDFSTQRLHEVYHADLAHGLGNLVSRLATLCEKSSYGSHRPPAVPTAPAGYEKALAAFRFDLASQSIWSVLAGLDRAIEQRRPWEDLRRGKPQAIREPLSRWLDELHCAAYWLGPFLPAASAKVLEVLGADPIRRCPPLFPVIPAENPGDGHPACP